MIQFILDNSLMEWKKGMGYRFGWMDLYTMDNGKITRQKEKDN